GLDTHRVELERIVRGCPDQENAKRVYPGKKKRSPTFHGAVATKPERFSSDRNTPHPDLLPQREGGLLADSYRLTITCGELPARLSPQGRGRARFSAHG